MELGSDLLARLPSIATMPILIGLLIFLRRKHPNLATRGWPIALAFIFVAQLEIFIGLLPGPRWVRLMPHVLLLTGQVLAAITLACHRRPHQRDRRVKLVFLICNTAPLLVFSVLYGYYIDKPAAYLATAIAAILTLLLTTALTRQDNRRSLLGSACWAVSGALAYTGHYRGAEYWLLSCVFALAILNFRTSLPRHTIGRFTILASLTVWALTFLLHPWLFKMPHWQPLARELWELQKFFLCIGMLLILLEDQVEGTQWLALHDQLTSLPNRRLLDESLDAAITSAQATAGKLAVFLVDLDGFKKVNDTHGHAVGDYVLVEVGRRMTAALAEGETLARLGGDEFVILSSHPENPADTESRLRHAIRQPLQLQGSGLSVDATFGHALYPEDTHNTDPQKLAATLLHIADQRMYQRKPAKTTAA